SAGTARAATRWGRAPGSGCPPWPRRNSRSLSPRDASHCPKSRSVPPSWYDAARSKAVQPASTSASSVRSSSSRRVRPANASGSTKPRRAAPATIGGITTVPGRSRRDLHPAARGPLLPGERDGEPRAEKPEAVARGVEERGRRRGGCGGERAPAGPPHHHRLRPPELPGDEVPHRAAEDQRPRGDQPPPHPRLLADGSEGDAALDHLRHPP